MIPFQATTSLHDAVVLSFDLKACASKSSQLRLATQVRRGKGCIFLLCHSNSGFEWLWIGIGICGTWNYRFHHVSSIDFVE